jgi:hypothetical protein
MKDEYMKDIEGGKSFYSNMEVMNFLDAQELVL